MKILIWLGVFITLVAAVFFGVPAYKEYRENKNTGGTVVQTDLPERTLMSGVAATTTGISQPIGEYQFINYAVATTATSGTVKFVCSEQDSSPTFASSSSATNRYAAVAVKDLESGLTIAGNTGVVFTNSTTIRHFGIENSGFKFCTAVLSPWTAGTSSVYMQPVGNR